jgi:hypothetical protein
VFEPGSRYFAIVDATLRVTDPDGGSRTVTYKRRRFLPPPESMNTVVEHTVTQGERPDSIAALYLGDPTQFWRLCDANGVFRPAELVEPVGTVIEVAMPGIGS